MSVKKVTLRIPKNERNEIYSLVQSGELDFGKALKLIPSIKGKRARNAFRTEVFKLAKDEIYESNTRNQDTIKEVEKPTKPLDDSPIIFQPLQLPTLIGDIREALNRNESLEERNWNIALRETDRTLSNIDILDHSEVTRELKRLRNLHQIVYFIDLESSLSEIRNQTDDLNDENSCYLRAAASYALLSTSKNFGGFNVNDFNQTEENNEGSNNAQESYPSIEEIEAVVNEQSISTEKKELNSEEEFIELLNKLTSEEKIYLLESIYFNSDLESPENIRKVSKFLAELTKDFDEEQITDKMTIELVKAIEIVGGTLYFQINDLASTRLSKENFDHPSFEIGSILVEDDDEDNFEKEEARLSFEAERQAVLITTIETDLIELDLNELCKFYEFAVCEQIRERISLKMISLATNDEERKTVAKVFMSDLNPDIVFPEENGIRKYNALNHLTKLLGKEAKPILTESLRSDNLEVKSAAFDILSNGKLTKNWGKDTLKKEIISSCKKNTNSFLFARLLLLSRDTGTITFKTREKCMGILKDVLSEDFIDFSNVVENLSNEMVCTYEISNILDSKPEELSQTNSINFIALTREILLSLIGYEPIIKMAYEARDNNQILSKNALAVFYKMLPEDRDKRIQAIQVLIANGDKTSKRLLTLGDLSSFGKREDQLE